MQRICQAFAFKHEFNKFNTKLSTHHRIVSIFINILKILLLPINFLTSFGMCLIPKVWRCSLTEAVFGYFVEI